MCLKQFSRVFAVRVLRTFTRTYAVKRRNVNNEGIGNQRGRKRFPLSEFCSVSRCLFITVHEWPVRFAMRNIAGNRTQGLAIRLKRPTADGYDTLLGKFLSTACALGNWNVYTKLLYVYIYIHIYGECIVSKLFISEKFRNIYWNLFLLEFWEILI